MGPDGRYPATPAALGMFRVGGNVTITAQAVDVLQLQLLWADETSDRARAVVMLPIGGGTLTTTGAVLVSRL